MAGAGIKRKRPFSRGKSRRRGYNRKVGVIRRIAKRVIYRNAETKQYVGQNLTAIANYYTGPTGFRTECYPLNGGALGDTTGSIPTGPSQGVGIGDRIGNKIYARGAVVNIFMYPSYSATRYILPVRMTVLYFRKGWDSNTNATGNLQINNTLTQLTTISRIDTKECVVLKDKRMLFYPAYTSVAGAVYPSNGVHQNAYYKRLYIPFKYKKAFLYQNGPDFYPNNGTYVLCFTYPYALADANTLGINLQQSMFFKDI